MGKLDVFPHGARIRVALVTPGDLAGIRLACDVSLHVLGTIAGVVETLIAVLIMTRVRLFPRVGPDVEFEVLQPRKRSIAALHVTLVWLLPRVTAQVRDELVASIEGFHFPLAVFPEAAISDHGCRVSSIQVGHQVGHVGKLRVAIAPPTHIGPRLLIHLLPFSLLFKLCTFQRVTAALSTGGAAASTR